MAVKIKHPFDVKIRIPPAEFMDEEDAFKRIMDLCDAFDAYEVERDVKDVLVVDVRNIKRDMITLRITLRKAISYADIYNYIEDMLKFVEEDAGEKIDMKIEEINWDISQFGLPSRLADILDEIISNKS